ncbi:MAG: hypothetical protein Q8L14_31400, partial [Myxococcales bacterium]|nr:hypothetical protein [Myxococcales bacterium]
ACAPGCAMNQAVCQGQCVTLANDVENCGMCGMACAPGSVCVMGQCRSSCEPPLLACPGMTCVDPRWDPDHCNGCGMACPPTPNAARLCIMGMCTRSICTAGFGDCNVNPQDGCETSFLTDEMHCGGCGRFCAMNQTCVSGQCQ